MGGQTDIWMDREITGELLSCRLWIIHDSDSIIQSKFSLDHNYIYKANQACRGRWAEEVTSTQLKASAQDQYCMAFLCCPSIYSSSPRPE